MFNILHDFSMEICNDPLKYIYGIFQLMAYVYLCYFFVSIFLCHREIDGIKKGISYIAIIILQFVISVVFMHYIIAKILLTALFMIIFLNWIFEAKLKNIVFWYFFFLGINLVIEIIVLELFKYFFPIVAGKLLVDSLASSLLGILSQMLLFLLVTLLQRMFGEGEYRNFVVISDDNWIRFLLFPIFTIISVFAILYSFVPVFSRQQESVILFISIGLCFMNVMVFSLLINIIKTEKKHANDNLLRENMKRQVELYKLIEEKYQLQKKSVHEFRNLMYCITGLVYDKQYDKLRQYIENIDNDIWEPVEYFDTNNAIINTIINQKYKEAQAAGIVFVLVASDLSHFPLNEKDTVILLSNIINNAFEACDKSREKIIKLKIMNEENMYLISASNTYYNYPNVSGNKFVSLKADADAHGVGIENVLDIVKKYNGSYVIDVKELFNVIIEIPMIKD